jgi:cation diffusion facilitator family transporter
MRLLAPVPIVFNQAIGVAATGLLVNLVSAWLLGGAAHHHGPEHGHEHGHEHDHDHDHDHGHHHHDLNLRSAYVHVAADAATSVLAVFALTGGKYWGATWLDAATGLVGSVVVALWAVSLLRDTSRVLLDAEMDAPVVEEIREAVSRGNIPAEIQDLHVWRVGRGKYACVLSVATAEEACADDFRALLSIHPELVHVTVEVNRS